MLSATPKSCLVSQVVFLVLAVGVCCLTGSGVRIWQLQWERAFSCSPTRYSPILSP